MAKLVFNTNELKQGLAIVSKAAAQRSTLDILSSVLIEAKDGVVVLTCSDQEKEISTTISETSKEGVAIAIPVKELMTIVSKLPGEETSLELKENQIVIRSGKSRFTLASKDDAMKFPKMSKANGTTFNLNGLEFADKLKRTLYAVGAGDGPNQIMGTIHFVINKGKATMTCLDGHRIAINNFVADGVDNVDIMIPATVGKIILPLLKEESLVVTVESNNINFKINKTSVSTRLVSGSYFKIDSMIANTNANVTVKVNTQDLLDTISRAKVVVDMASERKPVVLTLTDKGEMNVSTKTSISSMEETVDAEIVKGDWEKIGFNPKFLEELLLQLPETETVTMEFSNPKAPMIVRGESFLHLVLPVNIQA